jgi:hypothetical protein
LSRRGFAIDKAKENIEYSHSIHIVYRLFAGIARFFKLQWAASAEFEFDIRSREICAEMGLKAMKSTRIQRFDHRD